MAKSLTDGGSDDLTSTQGVGSHPLPPVDRVAVELAGTSLLGRYHLRRRLGKGGFAEVYLAHDEELDREVAIKIPRRDRFRDVEDLKPFVEEARTAARLQHPGIVQVFDVGTQERVPFIVLEYIRGRSLAHLLEHEVLSHQAVAALTAEIAEALDHAHENGFVHRDIKPANILLDTDDHAHIADFGLAVRHREHDPAQVDFAGTTHFMAPEQVRGETHRIDGRTDIWGLGVVLYRMLTGRLPFSGSTAQETFRQILRAEPAPPRELDATIPTELERICLRCLSRQMSERYRRGAEVVEDLNEWLRFASGGSGASSRRRLAVFAPPEAPLIPRGLRAFDQRDVDGFLRLLPGPRDRDGLPESIRFWKTRIEETQPEETFRVGLLYGPSGCGKSSLVKAGLVPRLQGHVSCVYLDATAHEFESRLDKALRARFPKLHAAANVVETLRALREAPASRGGKKILLVLDQFEQWLHAWPSDPDAELIPALRQCDGASIQCLLLVRDDFWLPVSRLMHQLEVPIVDDTNSMLVDSFDLEHAQRVLRELGVAYGRLPADPAAHTAEQLAFIEAACQGLAQDHRLFPIRLTVFVEMVKDRRWVPATLEEMGGAEGVGVAFLDHSVGVHATPARRVHERSARNVLRLLLPPSGQIKQCVRTRAELLVASGYTASPREFEALLNLLDVELRLLTPARSPGDESRPSSAGNTPASGPASTPPAEMSYQLTHDFLVPSIREWLERQERGSRTGRAQLLLREQADLWNSRPTPRYLPTFLEWLNILWRTDHRSWTDSQRQMMRATRRRVARQTLGTLVATLILVGLGGHALATLRHHRRLDDASRLVSRLQESETREVPELVRQLGQYGDIVTPALRNTWEDETQPDSRRRRAALALLSHNASVAAWLTQEMLNERTPAEEFLLIRDSLRSAGPSLRQKLHDALAAEDKLPAQRFRIACALAGFEPSPDIWDTLAEETVAQFLREPAAYALHWLEALRPVAPQLREPFLRALDTTDVLESAHLCALALFYFDKQSVQSLTGVAETAHGVRFRAILAFLERDPVNAKTQLRARLQALRNDSRRHREQANLALALFMLGDIEPLNLFSGTATPPDLRAGIIHGMSVARIDFARILPAILAANTPADTFTLLLLASVPHLQTPLSVSMRQRLAQRLLQAYREAPEPQTHAAADLLLRKLQCPELAELDLTLITEGRVPGRGWYLDKLGQTLVVLNVPSAIHGDSGTASGEHYRMAIASTELPVELFRQFAPLHTQDVALQVAETGVPAVQVLVRQVSEFCNWLSAREGIPPEQWCYPSTESLTVDNCHPLRDYLNRSGYRLPTPQEWEFACRAGTLSERFFGDAPDQPVEAYAWTAPHSGRRLNRVAELLPNPFGLFDTYGNAAEICLPERTPSGPESAGYVACGSGYLASNRLLSSHRRTRFDHRSPMVDCGFRVVRTLPSDE